MSVPYEVAISTIHGMFNGSIDKEVIGAVLEANQGHMEKTVECLLSMSGELPPSEKVNSEVSSKQNL